MSTKVKKTIDRLAMREYNQIKVGDALTERGERMYANLLGQKAYYHLTDDEMGKIIGVSRNTYSQKIRSGRFWPSECKAFCMYFNKPFDYLFATEEETVSEGDLKVVGV